MNQFLFGELHFTIPTNDNLTQLYVLYSQGGPEAFRERTNRQLEVSFLRHEDNSSSGRRRNEEYLDSLTACEELKTLHMSRCLAQYCVNNKLKSPLGKAQDTLTTVERVIRSTTVALLEDRTKGVSMPGCQVRMG